MNNLLTKHSPLFQMPLMMRHAGEMLLYMVRTSMVPAIMHCRIFVPFVYHLDKTKCSHFDKYSTWLNLREDRGGLIVFDPLYSLCMMPINMLMKQMDDIRIETLCDIINVETIYISVFSTEVCD